MIKYNIGVISDTHGLIREEALEALKGSDLIIHAGDIGKIEVIEELKRIAPVHCVIGNCDKGELKEIFHKNHVVEVEDILIYILHSIDELDLDPEASGFSVVITGHSHKPCIIKKGKVLYLNPGSAGPKRFSLPISVAKIYIENKEVKANIIEI